MDYILSIIGPLAQGSTITLKLFFITLLLAVPLGLALALVRISRFRTASSKVMTKSFRVMVAPCASGPRSERT